MSAPPIVLPDGYLDLPAGKVANVVTCLEMFEPAPLRPEPRSSTCVLVRAGSPDADWYRRLFRLVGEPFLWFSRLTLDDDALLRIIADPRVEVYAVRDRGEDVGFLELDFRTQGQCELVFFGLVESAVGSGNGRWLMNRALELAWSRPIRRFWVHTCSLDHPSALPFYIRSGFRPYKRQIEIAEDPRISGTLPRSAAPQIPIL